MTRAILIVFDSVGIGSAEDAAAFGPGIGAGPIGRRETLADIGETVAVHLELEPGPHGTRFYP